MLSSLSRDIFFIQIVFEFNFKNGENNCFKALITLRSREILINSSLQNYLNKNCPPLQTALHPCFCLFLFSFMPIFVYHSYVPYTTINFSSRRSKFGISILVGLYGTLDEDNSFAHQGSYLDLHEENILLCTRNLSCRLIKDFEVLSEGNQVPACLKNIY